MWYPIDQSGECLRLSPNDNHEVFEELSCLYPTWGKTFFSFEYLSPSHARFSKFLFQNTWLPYVVCAIYFASIFLGQKYMANRPAWNWRRGLAAWNLGLALFSMWGFARTAPQLAHNLVHYRWEDILSGHPVRMIGLGSTGFWVFLFILSKFLELFDTFFIVIHKKKLMFLHWYHHITVLLFCWHSWVNEQPMGLIFCVVNYAVHSVMYFYYFLMAIKCRPKWFNPQVRQAKQTSRLH